MRGKNFCSASLGNRPGHLYLTWTHLWFHSKILGYVQQKVFPFFSLRKLEKGTAYGGLSSTLVVSDDSATMSAGIFSLPSRMMLSMAARWLW